MAAGNFATVKLTSDLVSEARREAETLNRSLGGQIEHWARLGRALENAPGISLARVRQVLEGRLSLETLSSSEQDAVFDQMGEAFDRPAADVRGAYAALGVRPGAVGDDAHGRFVARAPASRRKAG